MKRDGIQFHLACWSVSLASVTSTIYQQFLSQRMPLWRFPITVLFCFCHILDMLTWLNQHIWHRSLSLWWKATPQPSPHCCQRLPIAVDEYNRLECQYHVKPRTRIKTALVIRGGQIQSSNSAGVGDGQLGQSAYQKLSDWNLENAQYICDLDNLE